MKWDMPIRPIESRPLTNREIKELNGFPLAEIVQYWKPRKPV
jgi:hypothetical protein